MISSPAFFPSSFPSRRLRFAQDELKAFQGYPSGLSGERIPLQGRICAVADVFDALTSKRPYKEAFPVPKALDIMHQGRAIHFDPRVLDIFLERMDEVLKIKAMFRDEADRLGNCAARSQK